MEKGDRRTAIRLTFLADHFRTPQAVGGFPKPKSDGLYWSNDDQTFAAEVPELPGWATRGDRRKRLCEYLRGLRHGTLIPRGACGTLGGGGRRWAAGRRSQRGPAAGGRRGGRGECTRAVEGPFDFFILMRIGSVRRSYGNSPTDGVPSFCVLHETQGERVLWNSISISIKSNNFVTILTCQYYGKSRRRQY